MLFALFLPACKKEETPPPKNPVAIFDYNPSSALKAPVAITFNNKSENATSYAWDFGDGLGTSTNFNPTYTYKKGGNYKVTLTAKNTTTTTVSTTSRTLIINSPTSIKITNVKLVSMPFVNPSNSTWDALGGAPDVYFELLEFFQPSILPPVSLLKGTIFTNLNSSQLPVNWTVSPFYQLTGVSRTFAIAIHDDDNPLFTTPELIGITNIFKLSQWEGSYDNTLVLFSADNKIRVELTVEWQ